MKNTEQTALLNKGKVDRSLKIDLCSGGTGDGETAQ
jgi:hypothetical protein